MVSKQPHEYFLTVLDLIKSFQADYDLGVLLDLWPKIMPRFYTIASY